MLTGIGINDLYFRKDKVFELYQLIIIVLREISLNIYMVDNIHVIQIPQ